ncbi:MAG: GNAT family N-acetyltransferase [Streptosporangiaceae bacterium]
MRIVSLGFRTDVALRVLEGAEVADHGDYLVIRSPDNPNFWWGNFILLGVPPRPGTAGPWLARFAAEFPAARHIALGVDAAGDQDEVPGEFAAAGLEIERATVLTAASVRPPPRPNSAVEIRPLASDADWRQALELNVRCFGYEDSQEYLERRVTARRRLTQAGTGAWFGAFAGGRMLAQLGIFDAGGGFARYQDVETDPAARRQGLAGTLVWHAGRYGLRTLGAGTLVIVADPAAEAIDVYRSCGFADAQAQVTMERPPAGRD